MAPCGSSPLLSGTYDGASGVFGGTPARTQAFEYDANSRLTRENAASAGATTDTRYEYDAAGNRTNKTVVTSAGTEITTYSHDSADRLTQESVSLAGGGSRLTTYGYDGSGNLAQKTEPGKVTLYRFDPQNRLIDIRTGATLVAAQAASPYVSYAYDASGNRVRKGGAQGGSFLVDSSFSYPQVALETQGAASTAYVRGLSLIRQIRLSGPVTQDIFPLQGHLGTSLGAVDADGNLVEQIDMDAFGNSGQATGLQQAHLYAGEYWDQDSNLTYLRARWYDPRIGQFISGDSFEGKQPDPRSLNRYTYAQNEPIQRTDPSGLTSLGEMNLVTEIQGALLNLAKDQAINYIKNRIFGDDDDDHVDGPPSVMDYLLANVLKALTGNLSASAGVVSQFGGSGRYESHHVIPVYVCGALNGRMSRIPKSFHDEIHRELQAFVFAANVAGKAMRLVFKKPIDRSLRTPLQKLGAKRVGREAIAAALFAFYAENDYLASGTPPIFVSMTIETARFIGRHHSAPTCQRP